MFSANENLLLRQSKKQVVQWVEATMPEEILDLGTNVMVMQVSCQAIGCVPLETRILILFPKQHQQSTAAELIPGIPESKNGGTFQTNILKPLNEVTKDDVLDALPPGFDGGRYSLAKVYRRARDIMLGQITQVYGSSNTTTDATTTTENSSTLFGGTTNTNKASVEEEQALLQQRLDMAKYLQTCLQEYIHRQGQVPPEGQDYENDDDEATTTTTDNDTKPIASSGNIVLRRPIDEETNDTTPNVTMSKDTPTFSSTQPPQPSTTHNTLSFSLVGSGVSKSQQKVASQQLSRQLNLTSADFLTQREHAPGIRRPGCPCCDPDNPSNHLDRILSDL